MATKKETKLKAEKRSMTGRKVKKLRDQGVLPANIYGKKIKSESVQLDLKTFLPVYQTAGETGVVYLTLKGESKVRPILIHNVQVDPVTDLPLHADFYQVSLKEKVTSEIPVETIGESVAVKDKLGILVQQLTEVEVEALPTELPDKFEINLGRLKAVGDMILVSDLKVPKGVTLLTGSKQVLAKLEPLTKKEEEKPAEEEAVVEGEAPSEEEKPEEAEKKASTGTKDQPVQDQNEKSRSV